MNVEIYSYSLFTTVWGMLVVFLSLSALSLMMVVLKAVFAGGQKPGTRSKSGVVRESKAVSANAMAAAAGKTQSQLPVWVPAALAVYFAEEQELERPSADPWNAVVNQYDPWMAGGRINKRGV